MLYETSKNEKTSNKSTKPLLSRFFRDAMDYGPNEKGQLFDRIFNNKYTERTLDRIDNTVGQGARSISYPNGMSPYGSSGTIVTHDPHTADPNLIRKQIAERILLDHWKNNREKMQKYDRMSKRGEIADALNVITNEAICPNDNGEIASLKILEDLDIGDSVKYYLHKKFRNDVVRNFFRMNIYGAQYFKDLLKYGRIFFEVTYSPDKGKITGLNLLPQQNMLVIVYEGEIIGYRQMLEGTYVSDVRRNHGQNFIDYSPNQVLYISLGIHGPGGENDPYGILEEAVKPYNQLNAIEDAVTMYRIAWGQEKMLFKIDVTNMPKPIAEAYIREQKNELSRRLDYNNQTGEVTSSGRIFGLSEHYFVPVTASSGSDITRIAAGDNIAKVDDVNMFKRNLVNALQVPPGLITALAQDSQNFTGGKVGEITQEQIKFYKLVMSYQRPLGYAMSRLFTMTISLDPMINKDIVDEDFYGAEFSRDNYFQFYLDAEINSTRFQSLSGAKEFIGTLFSRRFVLKEIFKMTDAEEALNAKWLAEEKESGLYDEETEE